MSTLGQPTGCFAKPLAQYVEALRAVRWRDESNLSDFHELRQGFIPSDSKMKNSLSDVMSTAPPAREASAIKITQNIQII